MAPFQALQHLVLVAAKLALLAAEDVQDAKDAGQAARVHVLVTVAMLAEQYVQVNVLMDVRELVVDVWLASMVDATLVIVAVMESV